MVWARVTSTGVKPFLIFIEDGVKINQHIYLNVLKVEDVLWVSEVIASAEITLQQNGATSHTAIMIQE